jgi:hypothetical protein
VTVFTRLDEFSKYFKSKNKIFPISRLWLWLGIIDYYVIYDTGDDFNFAIVMFPYLFWTISICNCFPLHSTMMSNAYLFSYTCTWLTKVMAIVTSLTKFSECCFNVNQECLSIKDVSIKHKVST